MVHIKKVEIFGFKSFGFKNTVVNFEPGLISIAGPNGSGKSNILDAIIFAMGEIKPKVMRVDKLRSLIHDIEGRRNGPKMTRVNLVLDNSDRKIPLDTDIVEITREMEEAGENQYLLNKKPTTRTQILDLLDIANAGLSQLNAVQQGTVTRISEFSAEEKRQAIENLIGLTSFDEKKAEALKQLDEADRRLEIALAKMGEIKKRIDELEEERNQKLRYDMIQKELDKYNAISAANKMRTIKSAKSEKDAKLSTLVSEISTLEQDRALIKDESKLLEEQKSKFMADVNAFNQTKASIDQQISAAMQAYEETNSGILAARKRIQTIENRIPLIHSEIESIIQGQFQLEEASQGLKKEIDEIDSKRKETSLEQHALDDERSKILEDQSRITAQKIEVDNKIRSLNESLNTAKLTLSKLVSENEDLQNKILLNKNRLDEFEKQLSEFSTLKGRLEGMMNNNKATIAELKTRITTLSKKKEKLERDLDDLNLILEKSSKAAVQYDTKIKTVKGIMHEDYSISKLKEESEKLGIIGLVYEMISWDKQYDRAVLAVGADWIKAAVVKDFEGLLALADFVRLQNLPRLKIIPIDAIPKFKLKMPKDKGLIGILSDYVKCDEKYLALKSFLFGNVILVESREAASRLSKSGYKAVTIDGECFEPKNTGFIVDINSKISKLTKIISMSTSVEGLQQSIVLLRKFILNKKHGLAKINEMIQNNHDRLNLSEKELAAASNSHSDLLARISSSSNTKSQLSLRITELEKRIEGIAPESLQQESLVQSILEQISAVGKDYSEDEQRRIASELQRLNAKKSEIEKRMTEIMNIFNEKSTKMGTLNAEGVREQTKIQNLKDEISSLENEKQELQQKIASFGQTLAVKNKELVRLRQEEQELISTSGASMGQLKEYDDKLKELHEKEKILTKDINSLERQSDSLKRDLNDLNESQIKIQKILDMYGHPRTVDDFDVDPILHALGAELKSLNSLNAKAPETYIEVADGYRSMSTRKNSLEQERNSIVRFIEEIEKDKRQTFLDAFDKVDKEIRNAFGTMTGGNAWLELQNEDDIFNSGISYLIQFPNKPKRESTSISGGEKTLAAIVFVLALQKLKPSPFYLFDEVDAHLDAPNSERLSKILEERSKESQFIMVSLKDSVVQKAKLIYGVYPKNGVSHIVTYKDKRLPQMTSS